VSFCCSQFISKSPLLGVTISFNDLIEKSHRFFGKIEGKKRRGSSNESGKVLDKFSVYWVPGWRSMRSPLLEDTLQISSHVLK
jgi:hypothetical protein